MYGESSASGSLPYGASEPGERLRPGPTLGGFSVNFFVPFERLDLYSELLADDPLGASEHVATTVLRPGYTPDMTLSPGCVRRASFEAPYYGETISELILAEGGPSDGDGISRIVWRQLYSTSRLNLVGTSRHLPEFGVTLEGGEGGCLVTMTYNFSRADVQGLLCCVGAWLPLVLKSHLQATIGGVWHDEMVRRSYTPLRKPQFGRLMADKSEEEQIRLRAALPRDDAPLLANCAIS